MHSGREMDWAELIAGLDDRSVTVIVETAQGQMNREVAKILRVTPARVTQMKRKIAGTITQAWGADALACAAHQPAWRMAMAR